jgi:hypothetical protein
MAEADINEKLSIENVFKLQKKTMAKRDNHNASAV